MRKVVLLAVFAVSAGLAWWFFDGSRRMSETQVRAHYREQLEATIGFDADRICGAMDEAYMQEDVSHMPDGRVETMRFDKTQGCQTVAATLSAFRQASEASGGMLRPEFKVEIARIDLAPDRKTATVEAITTVTVGERLLARSRGSERLIRRVGRIRSLGGRSDSWAY